MKFYITDVFGVEKYSGNQLLTVFDEGKLSTEEMQQIAFEINFSETTFITNSEKVNGGYDVRIFTPKSELPFAGHPTIGTAYIIDQVLENGKAEEIVLNLKVGQIPVRNENENYWMRQNSPVFGKSFEAGLMDDILGLAKSQIVNGFPIQEVSTGMAFTLVPLQNLKALEQAKLKLDAYYKFCETTEAKGIMVFCPEGHAQSQQISSRVFVEYEGIPEDPATGSATGCLASYLLKYNFLGSSSIDIEVGQGYEMGRPSSLLIRSSLNNGEFDINVGGKVIDVANGEWQ